MATGCARVCRSASARTDLCVGVDRTETTLRAGALNELAELRSVALVVLVQKARQDRNISTPGSWKGTTRTGMGDMSESLLCLIRSLVAPALLVRARTTRDAHGAPCPRAFLAHTSVAPPQALACCDDQAGGAESVSRGSGTSSHQHRRVSCRAMHGRADRASGARASLSINRLS
jgi:hypothetical protein